MPSRITIWDSDTLVFRSHGLRHGGIQHLMDQADPNTPIETFCNWLLMCPTSVRYYCVPNDKRAALPPPPEDHTDTSHALVSASLEQGGKRRRWGAPTEAFGPDELDALSRTCTEIACKNPNPPSTSLWRHILPQGERKQQEFPDGGSHFRPLIQRMVAQSIRLGKGIPRAFTEEIFGKVAISESASTLSLPNRLAQPIHIDVHHDSITTLPPARLRLPPTPEVSVDATEQNGWQAYRNYLPKPFPYLDPPLQNPPAYRPIQLPAERGRKVEKSFLRSARSFQSTAPIDACPILVTLPTHTQFIPLSSVPPKDEREYNPWSTGTFQPIAWADQTPTAHVPPPPIWTSPPLLSYQKR